MAKIRPFRGIRYDAQRFAQHLNLLVAPPYDVIDAQEQDALYALHPHNIVRLDLNRMHKDTDTEENNRYTRSRRHLMDWLATGVLCLEDEDAIYVHHQTFDNAQGQSVTRRGFISLIELAEYDEQVVLPHERTLRGPKIDRLDLMKATECNLSQVFVLYDDKDHTVDRALASACDGIPVVDILTPDGIQHQLWKVTEQDILAHVSSFFTDQQLLIADGHHRYETALAYRDFRRSVAEEPVQDAPYEYLMTFLVNMHDPGLAVFPTHRVVHGLPHFDADELHHKLTQSELFSSRALVDVDAADGQALLRHCQKAGAKAPSFVLLHQGWAHPLLVSFVGSLDADVFDADTPYEVRALDVAVLHEVILDRILGISKEKQEAKTNLRYKKKLPEAMQEYTHEDTQLVVLMNATPVEQVAAVCRGGGKMPQKSTYFYPKILSGLIINPL